MPDSGRHSPSQLLQCHRKLVYRQLNAPRESGDSDGVFYLGDVLEDLVESFLSELASQHGLYVQNSMYVNLDVEPENGESSVSFRGSTDPVLCDHDGVPVLPIEVKSKSEDAMEYLDSVGTRHRAQAHAYVRGLNERMDALGGERQLEEFAVLYIARETLEVRVFIEGFDSQFWASVVEWASAHTRFRENLAGSSTFDDDVDGGVLPPGVPEEPEWECEYCAYRKRCGKDDSVPVSDVGVAGLLPLTRYSRAAVEAHMEAYPDVPVSPTVAYQHPSVLAGGHPVADWECRECGEIPLDRVGWDGDVEDPPVCPSCGECSLRGPRPSRASVVENNSVGGGDGGV